MARSACTQAGRSPDAEVNNRARGKVADYIGAQGPPHRGARYRRKTPASDGHTFGRSVSGGRGALAPIRPTEGRAASRRAQERGPARISGQAAAGCWPQPAGGGAPTAKPATPHPAWRPAEHINQAAARSRPPP